MTADAAVRSTLGSYRLFDEVGRDPLGEMFLACPAGARTFPKWAVVRRMHAGVARDPVMVHSFLAATQAAMRMVHRNIAVTFDFGGKMTLPWAAREHMFGATIVDVIAALTRAGTKVPWSLAGYIVAEAAEGVAALRTRLPAYGPPMGFLAGAVAPSVFVTHAGEVKLVDGCMPLIDGLPLIDSQALPYRPGGPAPDPAHAGRSDAFGLGVILWELCAGRRLFAGHDDDETSRLLDANVVPSLRTSAKAPAVIDDIVQRALGKLATDAPPLLTAAEVATELRAGLAAQGKHAGAEDVARMMTETLGSMLAEQDALVQRAWAKEQEIQAKGDAPADLTSETDVTVPIGQTTRDATTETAISSRSSLRRAEGFDEVPTVPSIRGSDTPSWRAPLPVPPAPAPPPARERPSVPAPRIDYLPESTPGPPVLELPPREAHPGAPAVAMRAPLVLPPIERGGLFPPPPPRPPPAPVHASPPSSSAGVTSSLSAFRSRRHRTPMLVAGALGFTLAFIGIVVFGIYQPQPEEPDFVAQSAVPSAVPPQPRQAATPRTQARPSQNWTTLPSNPIPTASVDDLPRAPPPAPMPPPHTPRSWAPPPAGHTGLLTVFCTPACDEVFDGSRALGPSPVFKVPTTAGVHRLRLRIASAEKSVTVKVAENDTTVVRENVGN